MVPIVSADMLLKWVQRAQCSDDLRCCVSVGGSGLGEGDLDACKRAPSHIRAA
jgi:hypothetical protein